MVEMRQEILESKRWDRVGKLGFQERPRKRRKKTESVGRNFLLLLVVVGGLGWPADRLPSWLVKIVLLFFLLFFVEGRRWQMWSRGSIRKTFLPTQQK